MTEKRIAVLFETKPLQWSLRGDPSLWKEIVETIGELPLSDTETQLMELLNSTFDRLVGYPLTHQEDVYIERYAHGGISSGYVCLKFWREKLLPMLQVRYTELRSGTSE